MTVNLRTSINVGLNSGLRQSISGGKGGLGLFKAASLDLLFAKYKTLNDRVSGNNLITFSRASAGTYVDSDGLIKTSPVNLLTYSEQFDQWDGLSNETITVNATEAPDGSMTADRLVLPAIRNTYAVNSYTSTAGVHIGSLYVKAATPGTNSNFTLWLGNESNQFTATDEWQRISYSRNVTNDFRFGITNGNDTFISDLFIWGAQLEEGTTATDYIPTGATLSGAPRFDHDPVTGESLGLLIEESRTNRLLHSSIFSDILWTKVNTSVLDDQIVAPNGVAEADKLTATNTANESRHIRQDSTITTGKTYTQSVFAKAGEVAILQIAPSSRFNSGDFQNFDLSTGQLGSFSGSGTATIEAYPNGWYRCRLTRDSIGNTGQGRMLFALVESATSTRVESFQADAGDGLYLWGAQLEKDSTFPSSFIATAASSVTRSPDIASIEGTDFSSWYNQSEGTIFSDISPLAANSGRGYLFNRGNANQRLGLNTSNGNTFTLFMSNGSATSLATAPSGMPKPIKNCLAYKSGSSRGVINGELKILSTSTTTVPNNIDQVGLGCQNFDSTGFLNGHITRLAYFPTRKTDQELIDLTKP